MQEDIIYTLQESADYTGRSIRTLQRKIDRGIIIPVRGKAPVEGIRKTILDAFMKTDEYKNRRK